MCLHLLYSWHKKAVICYCLLFQVGTGGQVHNIIVSKAVKDVFTDAYSKIKGLLIAWWLHINDFCWNNIMNLFQLGTLDDTDVAIHVYTIEMSSYTLPCKFLIDYSCKQPNYHPHLFSLVFQNSGHFLLYIFVLKYLLDSFSCNR